MVQRRSTVTLFWLCLVVFVVGLSDAQTTKPPRNYWRPDNYPNPQNESTLALCGLEQRGLVCDPNGKLNPYPNPDEDNVTESGIIAVQDALRRIREETKCSCGDNASGEGPHCDQYEERGFTVAIALASYMDLSEDEQSSNNTYMEEKAREFAISLRERWNFGQCHDDVVIFVSVGDMKMWTAPGAAAANILTTPLIMSVSRRAKPLIEQGEYTKALLQIIGEYKKALKGEQVDIDKDGPHLPLGMPLWVLIVFAVLIFLVVVGIIVLIVKCCCTSKSTYQMGRQTP